MRNINYTKNRHNSGFVALMSAIIISIVLLLITTNLGFTGFYSRSNILDNEFKKRSSSLAEACIDTAILKLANNSSYTGSENQTISGSNTCNIGNIDPSSNPIIINTTSVFQNATTNLRVEVNKSTLAIEYYEEI
ncbi:MAG: hypothetical protein AAB510_00585 [Patescibacteria group bacterium]